MVRCILIVFEFYNDKQIRSIHGGNTQVSWQSVPIAGELAWKLFNLQSELPQLRKRHPNSWFRGYQSPPTSCNGRGTKGNSIVILACSSQLQQQRMNWWRWYQLVRRRRKHWKSYKFSGWRWQQGKNISNLQTVQTMAGAQLNVMRPTC